MNLTDASLGWASLVLPAAIAAVLALLIPWMLGKVLAQSMWGLGLNLGLSLAAMFLIAQGYFLVAYRASGIPDDVLFATAGLAHTSLVAVKSALFWGPLVVLQLATQPQGWRPEL